MELGASFSHTQLESSGFNPHDALKDFKSLGLKWIRLGSYWNEIEPQKGKYNFEKLDQLIEFCEDNKIDVILTVGEKAPRWPEYYIPDWASRDNVLQFIKKIVSRYKVKKCIKVWQVENEPLDPSGPKSLSIDKEVLKKEVELVRKLDPKKQIMVNFWGNELSLRNLYTQALPLADIIGIDLYPRCPVSFLKWFNIYKGPLDSPEKIRKIAAEINKAGKKVWISELQAEPWELGEIITTKKDPPSFLPIHFERNINYAKYFNPEVILLWGFEWWYSQKQKGDNRYWEKAKEIIGTSC